MKKINFNLMIKHYHLIYNILKEILNKLLIIIKYNMKFINNINPKQH